MTNENAQSGASLPTSILALSLEISQTFWAGAESDIAVVDEMIIPVNPEDVSATDLGDCEGGKRLSRRVEGVMMEVVGSRAAGQSLRGRLSVGLSASQPTTYLGAQGCDSEDGP